MNSYTISSILWFYIYRHIYRERYLFRLRWMEWWSWSSTPSTATKTSSSSPTPLTPWTRFVCSPWPTRACWMPPLREHQNQGGQGQPRATYTSPTLLLVWPRPTSSTTWAPSLSRARPTSSTGCSSCPAPPRCRYDLIGTVRRGLLLRLLGGRLGGGDHRAQRRRPVRIGVGQRELFRGVGSPQRHPQARHHRVNLPQGGGLRLIGAGQCARPHQELFSVHQL